MSLMLWLAAFAAIHVLAVRPVQLTSDVNELNVVSSPQLQLLLEIQSSPVVVSLQRAMEYVHPKSVPLVRLFDHSRILHNVAPVNHPIRGLPYLVHDEQGYIIPPDQLIPMCELMWNALKRGDKTVHSLVVQYFEKKWNEVNGPRIAFGASTEEEKKLMKTDPPTFAKLLLRRAFNSMIVWNPANFVRVPRERDVKRKGFDPKKIDEDLLKKLEVRAPTQGAALRQAAAATAAKDIVKFLQAWSTLLGNYNARDTNTGNYEFEWKIESGGIVPVK